MINKECIDLQIKAKTKEDVILEMVKKLHTQGNITDVESFYQDVLEREKLSPTYVGSGIGLPHGRTSNVIFPAVCIGRLNSEVLWGDDEDEKVTMVLLIAVPGDDEDNTHLKILSKLARKLMHDDFVEHLKTQDVDTIYITMKNVLEGE